MTDCKFSSEYFGETNQGMVRTNNEDTYICQQIWDDNHILCAAIDGLGGYEGGEVAAELARTTIIRHLEDFASKKTGDLLRDALIEANNEIVSHHKSNPKVAQMGCVASVGIIDLSQGLICIAHVGDSRIYQFVNGKLKKLTHDHSLVGYREEAGELSEEDAMNHPKRNVIDKYLGEQHLNSDSSNYVEISVWPITADTQYLFCSDGLTDLVTSARISEVLSSDISIKDKVSRLITSANDAGGKDNITVVIANVTFASAPHDDQTMQTEQCNTPDPTKQHRGSLIRYLLFGLGGLLIGIGISIAYFYCLNTPQSGKSQSDLTELQQINGQLTTRVQELEDSINKITLEVNDGSDTAQNDDTASKVGQNPISGVTEDNI